jgi:hypothetical protein
MRRTEIRRCGSYCFVISMLLCLTLNCASKENSRMRTRLNHHVQLFYFYLYTIYLLIPLLLLHQSDLSISLEDPLLFHTVIFTIHVNQTLCKFVVYFLETRAYHTTWFSRLFYKGAFLFSNNISSLVSLIRL